MEERGSEIGGYPSLVIFWWGSSTYKISKQFMKANTQQERIKTIYHFQSVGGEGGGSYTWNNTELPGSNRGTDGAQGSKDPTSILDQTRQNVKEKIVKWEGQGDRMKGNPLLWFIDDM